MANVLKAFDEYPADKLDGIWACYYNNLRSVMACKDGNDYKQAHNGGAKRKRDTGSAIDLTVNLVDYDECVELCGQDILVLLAEQYILELLNVEKLAEVAELFQLEKRALLIPSGGSKY